MATPEVIPVETREVVTPVAAEAPPFVPDNGGETLVADTDTVTVEDVHVSETEHVASFTVTLGTVWV